MTQKLRDGKGSLRLSDRLTADSGRHFLPGLQALVRFPLEQARLDRAAGLRIATYISGYPGSPLAGYDLALSRTPDVLADHDMTFVPAGNEELAATAHMGTQMLDEHPHANRDGVTPSGTARDRAPTAAATLPSTATSPAHPPMAPW